MGVATRPFFLSPEGEVVLTGRDGGTSQVHVTANCLSLSSEPLSLDPSMSSTIRSLGATPPDDEVLLVTEREETLDDDEMVSSLAGLVKISVFISEPSPRSLKLLTLSRSSSTCHYNSNITH